MSSGVVQFCIVKIIYPKIVIPMKAKRKLKQNLPNLSPKKEALSQIAKIEIPIKDELLTSVESDDEYSQKIVENIAEKESSERTEIKFDSSRANKEDLEMINEYLEKYSLIYWK